MARRLARLLLHHFPAFTHRDFRYFWLGQCASLIGTWMQSIAQAWLVYSITHSSVLLGVLTAVQFVPVMLLTLFAGVFVDRWPKKTILIVTQSISMVLAFILAALVFTHTVRYEYILALGFILGIVNAVDMPTRQAFVVELASREHLMNAIALNSLIFNLAKVLGPSISAVVMATLGVGWCFLLNGISFIAVIIGLIYIKANSYVREKKETKVFSEIMDGIRYLVKERVLVQSVFLVLIIGLFAFNYSVLLPVFVQDNLKRGADVYGVLMGALGIGSIVGALTASVRGRGGPKMRTMVLCSIGIGILYLIIGGFPSYAATIVLLAIVGALSIYFSTNANSTLQLNSCDEYRGRVMSVYALVFGGITPFGSLFVGFAIPHAGAPGTFAICGGLILVLTAILAGVFSVLKKPVEIIIED